jgi:hypothetical protein
MRNRLNHWAKRLFAKHRFVPVDLVPAVLILENISYTENIKSLDNLNFGLDCDCLSKVILHPITNYLLA